MQRNTLTITLDMTTMISINVDSHAFDSNSVETNLNTKRWDTGELRQDLNRQQASDANDYSTMTYTERFSAPQIQSDAATELARFI